MFKNCQNVPFYMIGHGSIAMLEALLPPTDGSNSVLYVVDHYFKPSVLSTVLPIKDIDEVVLVDTSTEPHATKVNPIVAALRQKYATKPPRAIVGMGGGSAMDIAKMISILLTNPGLVEQYQGWDLVKNKPIYKIAVPTVSGTGAEATRTAILTSTEKKLGINSEFSVYNQIIMDPQFLASVPRDQFFYTAMDCYIHNVESLLGKEIGSMSRAMAEKAQQMLSRCFLDQMNYEDLMVASYFGGQAVANANVGIAHPLSYGLSLVFGFRHGYANCLVFDQLEEYYGEQVREFREFMKRHEIELPRGVLKHATDEQIEHMATATLKNEKPLNNAFGSEWRTAFPREKVVEILKSI